MPKNTQSEQIVRTINGLPSIWPGDNESSPLPIIWLIGDSYTGKSSTIASIDPVRPGEKTRTLVTDLEGSHAALSKTYPMDVVDIRALTEAKHGPKYSHKHLFAVWWEYMQTVQPGQYTVLGVDPSSDLYMGSHQWVKENEAYFDKPSGAYRGKEGTMYAWGDVKLLWKQIGIELSHRFQTVVFTSHITDVYSDDGKRTGDKRARGVDFREMATLVLWLARESQKGKEDKLWAKVEKSRLTHAVWPEEGNEPYMAPMLPVRLEPKPHQSYPSLIRQYMLAPKPDYGELNVIDGYDPSVQLLTDEERELRKLELLEKQLQMEIVVRKNQIVENLVANYGYKDRTEVARVIHVLELTDDAQDLIKLDAVEQRLIDYKSEQIVQE